MPIGPSFRTKLRYSNDLFYSNVGVIGTTINVGGLVAVLTDFTNAALLFGRFTITRASVILLPVSGFSVA